MEDFVSKGDNVVLFESTYPELVGRRTEDIRKGLRARTNVRAGVRGGGGGGCVEGGKMEV